MVERSNPDWTVDETILALDLYLRRGRRNLGKADPDVVELSAVLNALPLHVERGETFRNPAGVAMKISNIASVDPGHAGGLPRRSRVDVQVWDRYHDDPDEVARLAQLLRAGAAGEFTVPDTPEVEEDERPEGALLFRRHRVRERDAAVVRRKKAAVLKAGGVLACEVCDFDFAARYGPLGDGYIECHHLVPLSRSGPVRTRLTDLALLCANCHRMVHRSAEWLTVGQLRERAAT